jgi:hypothetical protein
VAKHGRGQFGTPIVSHPAGLDPYWSDTSNNAPVGGVEMDSSYLFGQNLEQTFSSVFTEGTNRGAVLALVEEEEKINAIAFGDGVWAAAGNAGKFRISDDGLEWQTIADDNLDPTFVFSDIAYGLDENQNGIWVAVGTATSQFGQEPVVVTSPDRINWTIGTNNFISTNIVSIKYVNNLWIATGISSEIRSSTNLTDWTLHVPNFDRFPKTVTAIGLLPPKTITGIQQGAPAIFNLNNHGLKRNDKVSLLTTGTLPDGLFLETEYYAIVIDANRFSLALEPDGLSVVASSPGSGTHSIQQLAAILTASGHGMSDNNAFHLDTALSLPSGIESKKIYYARRFSDSQVGFSEFPDGPLIDFGTSLTGVSIQMNRFGEAQVNAVDFGNSLWVAVADNGQISTSPDLSTWSTFDSGFGSSRILDVIFANNLWVAAGADGKLRTSTNGTTWTTRTSNFGNSRINSLAFGNSIFVAAGNDSKLSTSTDGITWTARTTGFAANIFQAKFGNRWVIVGDRLQVKTSNDAITWQDQTNDNAGQILFQTFSPHNLTPLDYVRFYTTGSLPADKPKEQKQFNSISIGSPAIFTRVGHGLSNGEEVRLFTTGRLPAGLSTDTSYYVRDVGQTDSPPHSWWQKPSILA